MSVKQTFAKLTEDLETLEKSEQEKEVTVEEPKAPIEEPEVVEPAKEEPVVEEPKAEEPKEEPKEEPVVEPEKVEPAEEPKGDEEVEKSKKEDKEDKDKDKEKEKSPKDKKEKGKEDKEKEEVKKSEDSLTGEDFLKAFQAIHKSLGTLPSELAEIKTTLANVIEVVNSLMQSEQVAKSEQPAEEPTTEEAEVTEVEEEVVKSAEQPEEEELDGKAVEFVSKSNGVPEIAGEEPQVEEEVVVPFNPQAHVDKITQYYEEKSHELSQGAKANIRSAVHRIKRGQPTDSDVRLAEQIVNFYGN